MITIKQADKFIASAQPVLILNDNNQPLQVKFIRREGSYVILEVPGDDRTSKIHRSDLELA